MMNKKAYTLIEVMMALAISLVLLLGVFVFYHVAEQFSSLHVSSQTLESGANIVLGNIIEGKTEPGGVYRLMEAESYCIGAGTGPACHMASTGELHFWGTDGIERWYHLNDTGTALLYYHPTAGNPEGADEILYTVPSGTTMALLFWIPVVQNNPTHVVGVKVTLTRSLTQQPGSRVVTGTAATLINLRNHP